MASWLDLFEEFISLEGTKIGLLKQDSCRLYTDTVLLQFLLEWKYRRNLMQYHSICREFMHFKSQLQNLPRDIVGHRGQYYLKLTKTLLQTSWSERLKWILNKTQQKNIVIKIKVQERIPGSTIIWTNCDIVNWKEKKSEYICKFIILEPTSDSRF